MKPNKLWRVSISTRPEAEEAVAELLGNALGESAGSFTDAKTGQTVVSLYFQKRGAWSQTARARIKAGLERIKACGLNAGSGAVSVLKVRREDWAESWKRHFPPLEIGSSLLIRPSWSHRHPHKGQSLVVLDPGLSFGTGQHPTTAFCLKQLAACRKPGGRQSFLDIGTGSGILAISAAKLGYAPVHAIDIDPEALRVARANARENGLTREVKFRRRDLAGCLKLRVRKYSVVCANLMANLLRANRAGLVRRLRADGVLVLAGILKSEFAAICRAYQALGLHLVASEAEGEWRSGAFRLARRH